LAKDRNSRRDKDSVAGSSELLPPRQAPVNRIEKIAGLLSELADLMRQEDLGKESLHHLRQLQMRIRFAQERSPSDAQVRRPLPQRPPAWWLERQSKDESPIDFIRREWGEWLGHGLTKAHLRADMSLYQALKHWLRKNEMPPDVDLPSKQEMTDRKLADLESLAVSHSPEQRELMRLKDAARRRAHKKVKGGGS
jgi:hypothetical protein